MGATRPWIAAGVMVVSLIAVTGVSVLFDERAGRREACPFGAVDSVLGELLVLNDNGAWSWYEDERAVLDGSLLIVSSVADDQGVGGMARAGNVELVAFDLKDGHTSTVVLSTVDADDHNSAALLVRPDGRYLAAYSNHHRDTLTRYRISVDAHDPAEWDAERTFDNGAPTSYSNLIHLAAEDRTYLFTRTHAFDPNVLVSDDLGLTWNHAGWLLKDPRGDPLMRPYVKYVSDDAATVYFVATDGHPNRIDSSIYGGYLRGGRLHSLDGASLGGLAATVDDATDVATLTPMITTEGQTALADRSHGWPSDLALTSDGRVVVLLTTRVDSDRNRSSVELDDHRFHYGVWNGNAWVTHEVAKAGPGLYPGEDDYTGLGSIDPDDPSTIYLSTNIDPATGADLARYEIYRGATRDLGASWRWTALTAGSSVDNLRPIVPQANGTHSAVLWLRGTYTTYTEYDLAVVALADVPTAATEAPSTCTPT